MLAHGWQGKAIAAEMVPVAKAARKTLRVMGAPVWGCLPLPAPFLSAHMAHRGAQQTKPMARGMQVRFLVSCNL